MNLRNSIAVVLVLFSAGCSIIKTSVDSPAPVPNVKLQDDRTHFHAVLKELGPPSRITALPGGFAFLYESLAFRELQLGLGGPQQYEMLSLLKLTLADANLHHQAVLFHFRSDGYLLSVAPIDRREDVGIGGSIQLLISVAAIVDTSDYVDDSTHAMRWGMSLLDPLPRTLNSQQSLRTGRSGLELGGTSSKVGQHTLEL